jgi:cytochrome P450/nitrite reductase/ring-hydroxylating ferredoxin subunit
VACASATRADWHRAAPAAALDDVRPLGVEIEGRALVLLSTARGAKAFSGVCPHRGGLLAGGEMRDGVLVCQNHGWAFDIQTGQRRGGPQCLEPFECEDRGGELWVRLPLVEGSLEERSVTGPSAQPLRRIEDLPGPRRWPWVGNTLQLDVPRLHLIFEAWAKTYGDLYRLRIGRKDVVVVSNPPLTEQVLRQRPHGYRRGMRLEPVLRELDCHGVFSAEGNAWLPQRKLVMNALAARNLRAFYPRLVQVAERLLERWRSAAVRGAVFDLHQDLMRFTVDVTTWLSLGRDLNTIQHGNDALQGHLEVLLAAIAHRLFAVAPIWRWFPTGEQRRVTRALRALHAWIDPLIDEIRELQARDRARASAPQNLLEAIVAARMEDGSAFPHEVLVANALVMLMAGEDTTAGTLAWAVHELCDSPATTAKLRAEADSLFGKRAIPSLELLDQAAYTLAVAHETTRLRPVVPTLAFEANFDQTLGDLAIPAGANVILLFRPPALDARRIREPLRFEPARWLDGRMAAELQSGATHVPFGSGPRMCPARSLALVEFRLVLSLLYRNFHVHRVGSRESVREISGTMMAPSRVMVRLEPR